MQEQDGWLQRAGKDDLDLVLQLLNKVNLPIEGVKENFHNFLILRESTETGIIGCIGLEVYGSNAILRSVAVHPEYQRKGVGVKLLNGAIDLARSIQVDKLYLLTDTAEHYFLNHGFEYIDRTTVPQSIGNSNEFTTLCLSATSMYKNIA
ncbi:MAG: arsenic resistance N-acetyltransferase ArsN2 [Candidatus Thorarchaeota archaeon]